MRLLAGLLLSAAVDAAPATSAPVGMQRQSERSRSAPDTLPRRRAILDDTLFFAEGVAVDPRDGTVYVTSLRHGNVWRQARHGGGSWLLESSLAAGVFGIVLDTTADEAWLTAAASPVRPADAPGAVRSELLRVSLRTGVVRERRRLGDGTGMPGEIARAPDGTVLVSDGTRGRLYTVAPQGPAVVELTDELLRSPQGIAPDPSRPIAWVADWSRGVLRWDRARGTMTRVIAPAGADLRGIDGLRTWRGGLLAVQNGTMPNRVLLLRLDPMGTQITSVRELARAESGDGEFTVGALYADTLLVVATSAWPFYDQVGRRRAEAGALPAVHLRVVPLPVDSITR
jgi:sugar lactone lactonase YvrE